MPDDDWALAQGTVDFRNEERRHRNRGGAMDDVTRTLSDVIDAMQERNRSNVHRVKGVQAALQNRAQLIDRDGVTDPTRLAEELRSGARQLAVLAEELQRDIR